MMITIILSAGAINGLVIGITLLSVRTGNVLATRIFGCILILISLLILETLLSQIGFHRTFAHYLRSTDGLLLLILPLLYLYAVIATETKSRLTWYDGLHLIPFVTFTIALIPYYLLDGEAKLTYTDPDQVALLAYLKAGVAFIYFPMVARHVWQFLKKSKAHTLPPSNLRNVQWFYRVLLLLMVIGASSLIFFTLETLGLGPFYLDSDVFTSILLTLAFYVNGLILISNPFTQWGTRQFRQTNTRKSKYSNSPLSEKEHQHYLSLLMDHMEKQQAFKDPELSPKDLEQRTGIKSHYITEVLNVALGRNFNEFVNAYRVEEVQKSMADPANDNKTLLALSFEAGFNSKASFNRVFKLHTGKPPSRYKKELQGK